MKCLWFVRMCWCASVRVNASLPVLVYLKIKLVWVYVCVFVVRVNAFATQLFANEQRNALLLLLLLLLCTQYFLRLSLPIDKFGFKKITMSLNCVRPYGINRSMISIKLIEMV